MKRNKAVICEVMCLAMLIAVPLIVRAGTWQPLNHQPPMPDIKDPQTGAVLSSGGAVFPLLLTDGSVIVQNVNTQVFHADGKVLNLSPILTGAMSMDTGLG
jgi:hypothetical protein